MVLEHRPEPAEIISFDVVDPKDRMGIADVDDRRRMQDRFVDWPDLQLDRTGIVERL